MMATRSSQPPFQVTFRQGSGSYEVRLPITEFCSQAEVATRQEPMVVLTENLPLRLQFTALDQTSRLYMDGLESVPQEGLQEDSKGRPFLPVGQHTLFSYDNYGWIPGLYWLMVQSEGERHFALVLVQPKELSLADWTAMRDELEHALRGLALELASHNLGLGQQPFELLPPALLHQFLVIGHYFPQAMASLTDLETKANRKVKRLADKRRVRPSSSRRSFGSDSGQRARARTPARPYLDYDLPENRWVKRIVRDTSRELRHFLLAEQSFRKAIRREQAMQDRYLFQASMQQAQQGQERLKAVLNSYEAAARKMLHGLQMLRHSEWYQQIGAETWGRRPQALLQDGRYHVLYQLWQRLQSTDWQPALDQSYRYQWKRTDKLYEIWCAILICRALTQLGFAPLSGWLYDQVSVTEQMLVPSLPSGTCISFRRGETDLRLTYDQEIPRQSLAATLPDQPVYTQDVHNRPDLRLDIYQDQVFVGCLIIECKYRPLRGFWKVETLLTGYDRPRAMGQLISYGMAIRSPFLHARRQDWSHTRSPAALEVWAIHPGAVDEEPEKYEPDHRVRIFCQRPGVSLEPLTTRLAEILGR